MDRPVKRILISGYYGFDNSGDEAVLLSILQALAQQTKIQAEPVVLSNDPEATTSRYGVEAVHRMKPAAMIRAIRSCDGVISGGGSLLQDVTGTLTIPYYLGILRLAQFFKKPTFIYSQGIGPVHRPIFHKWIRSTLRKTHYLSVRDEKSAQLLGEMGIQKERMEVVPDPVMGIAVASGKNTTISAPSEDELPRIGVSVRYWNDDRSDLKRIAVMLAEVVSQMPAELIFLPFHEPYDRQASEDVINDMKSLQNDAAGTSRKEEPMWSATVMSGLNHPEDMIAAVSQCDVIVGVRLHSLIYAASQKVPLAGISYDPKIERFLEQLGQEPIGTTSALNTTVAAQSIINLIQNKTPWIRQNEKRIDELKQKSQIPAQQISHMLRNSN